MFNIPKQITQGDKTTWTEKLPDYNPLTDTLSCFIRGQKALDLTGTATTEGWDFTIESAESETLIPGKYKTQFVILEFGTDRNTLGTTELIVCPSFEKLTELETRSADEIELEAITQAIARHSNGVKEYWIGDRKMEYRDLQELYDRQQYLRTRIAMAKNPSRIGGSNVGIRFSN